MRDEVIRFHWLRLVGDPVNRFVESQPLKGGIIRGHLGQIKCRSNTQCTGIETCHANKYSEQNTFYYLLLLFYSIMPFIGYRVVGLSLMHYT